MIILPERALLTGLLDVYQAKVEVEPADIQIDQMWHDKPNKTSRVDELARLHIKENRANANPA